LIFQQLFDDPFILHFDLNRPLYHPPHPLYLSLLLTNYLCVTWLLRLQSLYCRFLYFEQLQIRLSQPVESLVVIRQLLICRL
jgi:hypothetical protein